jgi:hypothetical protein
MRFTAPGNTGHCSLAYLCEAKEIPLTTNVSEVGEARQLRVKF